MVSERYFMWRKEMQKAFDRVSDVGGITRLIEQQTLDMGFDYYALYIRHPVPFTRPEVFVFNNYPKAWVRIWMREKYADYDPVIAFCQTPGKLLLWHDPELPKNNVVMEAAKVQGIQSGFSYSVMEKNRATGILSMASRKMPEGERFGEENQLKLHYLTALFLEGLMRINDVSMSVMSMTLSQRELEILKWTAEGKTAIEIALILSISEHTVNFHQKKMQKKFNAQNKTQVAAYAAAIGLL